MIDACELKKVSGRFDDVTRHVLQISQSLLAFALISMLKTKDKIQEGRSIPHCRVLILEPGPGLPQFSPQCGRFLSLMENEEINNSKVFYFFILNCHMKFGIEESVLLPIKWTDQIIKFRQFIVLVNRLQCFYFLLVWNFYRSEANRHEIAFSTPKAIIEFKP